MSILHLATAPLWCCAGDPQFCVEDVDKPIGDTNKQRQNFKTPRGRGRCSGSPGKARVLLVGNEGRFHVNQEKVAFQGGV